ncbi:hypothetical protein JCM11641_007017 [Rhodosporidiobolus odoratus]
MASYVAKKVGRNVLGGQIAGYEPADPHYETYEDHKGRKRSRKRPMPPGLSKRDERILRSVRRRAHYLDKGFNLCGFRVGWTFFIGLIPGLGDVVQFLLGYMLVLRKCKEAEIPFTLAQRMTFNQSVGLGLGLVPLVGDLCLAVWKANSRNAALLEDFLIRRAAKAAAGSATTGGDEEDLAALALGAGGGKIDKISGEMVGGARPLAVPTTGGTGPVTSTSGAGERVPLTAPGEGGGKKWYGWGGGKKVKAEVAPAQVTTS